MEIAALLTGLRFAKEIAAWIMQQAMLLNMEGAMSDEQLAQIKAEANASDEAWDAAVAAARARIAERGE